MDEYFVFTNFTDHPIIIDNKNYPTSEHYFQSKKYEGTEYEEIVRKAPTPSKAKELGNSRKLPLRKDWEDVKDQFMYNCVLAKFQQHKDLKKLLVETGDKYLNEPKNSFFGIFVIYTIMIGQKM